MAGAGLAGSLAVLFLFDREGPRWHYLAALALSFTFLIGPSLHAILTGLVGVLSPPL